MNCKYCDKPLKEQETNGMCKSCYNKIPLVRKLVVKCQKLKRKCK